MFEFEPFSSGLMISVVSLFCFDSAWIELAASWLANFVS